MVSLQCNNEAYLMASSFNFTQKNNVVENKTPLLNINKILYEHEEQSSKGHDDEVESPNFQYWHLHQLSIKVQWLVS